MEKLLTTKEVAALLDKSRRTLRAWRAAGKGPEWHLFGCSVMYPADKLADWQRAQGESGKVTEKATP
jgi:hypothetical protein